MFETNELNNPRGPSMTFSTTLKASVAAACLIAFAGCTDLKPIQAQIDDLKSQVAKLQSDTAKAESDAQAAKSAASSASSAASGAQSTANQALSTAQQNSQAIEQINEKIDRCSRSRSRSNRERSAQERRGDPAAFFLPGGCYYANDQYTVKSLIVLVIFDKRDRCTAGTFPTGCLQSCAKKFAHTSKGSPKIGPALPATSFDLKEWPRK